MIQIKRGAATVATVNPLSSSNMTKAVMGDEQITLVWEAPAFVSYYLGDYITFEGANWTLNKLPTVKKLSSKTWQYNAVFQSTKYELIKAMYLLFDNTDTLPSGEFPLTGTANTFMELLVANLNRVAGSAVWTVGQVIENTDYKNLTFSNEDCLSVLARLASEFDTEYHVHNHIIHLKKISTEREITLQYGSTLYDIERSSVDSSDVVTRLYPFGSTKNLAPNYRGGNSPLRLPLTPPSGGGGAYIESNANLYGIIEQSKTFDDIYPRLSSGVAGVVTAVENEFTFTDSALDFDLNEMVTTGEGGLQLENPYKRYLLDGTPAKVHFNTGECAGYDFEIASYNHATKTFVLIPNTQENDFTLPTDDLKPAVGDKYVLIDIVMPPAYLAAAEAELLTRAQEYMSQNSTPKVAYKTTFSAIYAKLNLQNVECGDSVTVYDADMGINEQIRIVKLTKGLTDFWTVQFDLSNTVTATRLQRIEGNLAAVENNVIVTNQRVNRNNLRAYQNTKELREMVFDPDGYFDAENIKPLSIETSMLSVGAKSQSFQLSSLLQPNYAGNPQVLQWSAGLLTHFTIADDQIKEWTIAQGSITITGGNQTAALYIYARCSRAGTTGDIYLSVTATKFDADATYYFFLIGVLHTPINSVRGISLTYGQTTINGQFIKTGVISSIDGATYFNLNTGEIGGNIKFRSTSGALKSVEQAIDEIEVGGVNLVNNSLINESSSVYGFGARGVQVEAGNTYTLSVNGNSTNALNGKKLKVYIFKVDWSFAKEIEISESENTTKSVTFSATETGGLFIMSYYFDATEPRTGSVHVNWYKLEKGNKATDWSPSPEDVQSAINAAQNTANTANQSVSSLNTYVDGAFKNGVIDSAEAKAIEKYINTVNTEYDKAINSYNVIYANSYLEGTPKTTLLNAKVTLTGAKDSLMSAISTAIADGKTTVSEKAAVDAAYASYKSAFGSYSTALENANKAIQQKLDSLSTSKVNAIEVGARNLIFGTNKDYAGWGNLGSFVVQDGKLTDNNNYYNAARSNNIVLNNFDSREFVLTCDIICASNFYKIEIENPNTNQGIFNYQVANGRNEHKFIIPVEHDVFRVNFYATSLVSGSITIENIDLKNGNKSAGWSPAPEDTQKILDEMSSDNKLTAQEKSVALKEWQAIQGEYTRLSTLATQLGVSNTLSTPYTNLANYINPLLSSMTVTSDIVGSTFRSYFTAYYNASTDLQNALTSQVQSNISNLVVGGENLIINSNFTCADEAGNNYLFTVLKGSTSTSAVSPSPYLENGKTYVFTADKIEKLSGSATGVTLVLYDFVALANTSNLNQVLNLSTSRQTKVFTVPATGNWSLIIYCGISGATQYNSIKYTGLMCQEGNKPTTYKPATEYLTNAYKASTDIQGGVVQTAILMLRNLAEQVTAGMSGLNEDNIGMWAGGTYQQAIDNIAKIILRKDGSGQLAGGNIKWDVAGALELLGKITAGSGKIGGLDIFSNSLKSSSMSFSETPVESLASLISPSSVSISNQSSWSVNSNTGTAMAYSQNFVVPVDSQIKFRASATPWFNGLDRTWSVTVQQVGGSVIFSQSGSGAISNQLFTVNVPAGTYIIRAYAMCIVTIGQTPYDEASITGETINVIYAYGYNFQTKIGNNGFYSFWDVLKYIYYSSTQGLVVRGATDIPAGLGGASINSAGGMVASSNWGKITGSDKISRSGNNYTITHNIGDTNYSVQIIPGNSTPGTIYYSSKQPNTIVVTCAGAFDFVLIRTK